MNKSDLKLITDKLLKLNFHTGMILLLLGYTLFSQSNTQLRIHPDVFTQLQQKSGIYVLIDLDDSGIPELHRGQKLRKDAIQSLQNSVLSKLNQEDFNLRYRFEVIAALSGLISEEGIKMLSKNPLVTHIYPDVPGRGTLAQSVPVVMANQVHGLGITGDSIVVGVLDTGIDTDHPDLADAVIYQYHFLNQGSNVGPGAEDDNGHGTNVSGIVTANGIVSSIGVAPSAQIAAIKVLNQNSAGWVSDWTAGIDHIVAHNDSLHVKIINMSLGTWALYNGNCDFVFPAFTNAIALAKSAGILIFSSSGNAGSFNSTGAPTCISGCYGVGALYDADLGREPDFGTYQSLFGGIWPATFDPVTSPKTITCFTNRDQNELEFLAPGARITSTGMGGGTSTYIGTSQASPHLAGTAALLLEKDSTLSPDSMVYIIKNSGPSIYDSSTGWTFPSLNSLNAIGSLDGPVIVDSIPDITIEENTQNLFVADLRRVFFYAGGAIDTFSLSSGGNVTGTISNDSLFISASTGFTGIDTLSVVAEIINGASVADEFFVTVVSGTGINKNAQPFVTGFKLDRNYPNPFNPVTTISFQLTENSDVRLSIYNVLGHQIVVLLEGKKAAGLHTIEWDGRNDRGRPVSSGVYLYMMEAGNFRQVQRMQLVR